jgi:peptidoglycan biosynthesis protein MviN/MurJ (putative lipid II flippase)
MAYMRRLATLDEVGTNAALTYCLGLVTPVSVLIGKPIALATGPNYSRLFAQGKWESVSEALRSCFLQSLGVSVAIACLISYFPCQILSVFYGGGAFDSSAVTSMAALCSGLAWSLPAATVLWVILLPLLNLRSRILPAVIYIVGYALQIVVTAFLFSSRGRHSLVLGYLCGINFQAVLATAVIGRELLLAKKRSLHEACC